MNKRLLYTLLTALAISCIIVAGCSPGDSSSVADTSADAAQKSDKKSETTGGETTGGESTGGESTGGESTGGESTGGETKTDVETPLNEALGEDEIPEELQEQAQEVAAQVAENPVVTDEMREVMEHHGIDESEAPATTEEQVDDIVNDPKNKGEEVSMEQGAVEKAIDLALGTETAQAQPPNCTAATPVAIFRNTTAISDNDLHSVASTIDNQLWNQYSLYYHCAYAYYAPTVSAIGSGSVIMYVNNGAASGAQGGHVCATNMYPYASNYGMFGLYWPTQTWDYVTRSISHEVIEALSNPCPDQGASDQHTGAVPASVVGGPSNDWVSVQKEIADAMGMEADYPMSAWTWDSRYWMMSDFVFPSWYVQGSAGPWDYQSRAGGPFQNYGSNAITLYYYPAGYAGNGSQKYCKSFVDPQYYCVGAGQKTWF